MRSVRSLAYMSSWAQLKNVSLPDENGVAKEKKGDKKKEKKPKGEKGGEKKKEKVQTVRMSSCSFEVGGLTASPEATKTLGPKRKHSVLGLGLPSTIRLPIVRTGSTASSNIAPVTGRLSVDPAAMVDRSRSSSVLSTGSSLRPLSLTSTDSRASSASTVSVRWDEQGLEMVKEQRKKEREDKRQSEDKSDRRASKESRQSSDGRRRTPLPSIFPSQQASSSPNRNSYPIVTIEEATSDGHGSPDDDEVLQEPEQDKLSATPVKRRRSRPRPMHEDDEGQFISLFSCNTFIDLSLGVLSILDAATNNLALLINTLNLQATPSTPDLTPLRPSSLPPEDGSLKKKELVVDTPSKKTLRSSMASISPSLAVLSSHLSALPLRSK